MLEPFSLRMQELADESLFPEDHDWPDVYLPPHENEKYLDLINWSEWT